MHPEDMFPPELMQDLITLGIVFVVCVLCIAIFIIAKKAADAQQKAWEEENSDCMKTEDGDEVCLKDQYAASMVRPFLPDQEEECPECPPCYCAIHGTNCPDIFRRLRELVGDFTLESTLHEGSRFEHGKAAAYSDAATRLTEVLDELEGNGNDGT